jgi:hypothetical protein
VYIVEGTVSDAMHGADHRSTLGRINGGELEGRNEEGTAREIIVNPVSHQYLTHEHSPGTSVLLYEGNLDTVDISALRHTLRRVRPDFPHRMKTLPDTSGPTAVKHPEQHFILTNISEHERRGAMDAGTPAHCGMTPRSTRWQRRCQMLSAPGRPVGVGG